MTHFIKPDWPAPPQIKAYTTLRASGVSPASEHDKINSERLVELLQLTHRPIRIKQTHSNHAVPALPDSQGKEADAIFTSEHNQVCLVTTADCLPILLTHRQGTTVAAIHAGWRGLENGIIAKTFEALPLPGADMLAWLGPAISQPCYEVGEEVRQKFLEKDPATLAAFIPSVHATRWLLDLYAVARLQLTRLGVTDIFGGQYCTYSEQTRFFSYRRDGSVLGVMATLIFKSE